LLTYVRGRTFRRRLEPKISGEIFEEQGVRFLSIVASVKNVGLSRAEVFQKGTWVRMVLLQMKTGTRSIAVPKEIHLGTAPILGDHSWIEPGEEVHDVLLVQLPERTPEHIAIRLSLKVKSQEWRWIPQVDSTEDQRNTAPEADLVKNLVWSAASIVPFSAPQPFSNQKTDPD
jgi:hypothetical protein